MSIHFIIWRIKCCEKSSDNLNDNEIDWYETIKTNINTLIEYVKKLTPNNPAQQPFMLHIAY